MPIIQEALLQSTGSVAGQFPQEQTVLHTHRADTVLMTSAEGQQLHEVVFPDTPKQ
jgi:hypothetical protein